MTPFCKRLVFILITTDAFSQKSLSLTRKNSRKNEIFPYSRLPVILQGKWDYFERLSAQLQEHTDWTDWTDLFCLAQRRGEILSQAVLCASAPLRKYANGECQGRGDIRSCL